MSWLRLVSFCLLLVLLTSSATQAAPAEDLLVADFEGSDYAGWTTTGTAFGVHPARGTLDGQMAVSGFAGKGLVNSFFGGDGPTGTLTSPPIKIERRHLNFLLGGGGHPGETCINLLVDGKVVRTATGDDSEHLEAGQWSVRDFIGKEAVIEIVDRHTGGWGHVNIDQIVQSDFPLPGWQLNVGREFRGNQRYLLLPIKNGRPKHRMKIKVDKRVEREFDIELAPGEPDWWAYLDVSSWQGKLVEVELDRLRAGSLGLQKITLSDELPNQAGLYREALRPQFHFSARRGWLNDPNGLIFYEGEYHLFFQHNPYGWNWGNMHWGHAVSKDLVHWQELPIAIYPDAFGTAFSGSAVVDVDNTAGFQTGKEPPLVCIYTSAGSNFTQFLTYSNDRGRTWTKYSGNPVLPQLAGGNRDPKVFWYAPQKKWVMALYLEKEDFALFESHDLKKWVKLSDLQLPGSIECPEIFSLPVVGKPREEQWIFYGANGGYLLGQFDGRNFNKTSGPHSLHHGNCFYASQTFNNIPTSDGRRILIPWGQVALPGMPFNQMMGLPVEVTLHSTTEGPRLFAAPVRELESLRGKRHPIVAGSLKPDTNPLAGISTELAEVRATIVPGQANRITFKLRGVEVVYDVAAKRLTCLDQQATLGLIKGELKLHLFIDRASLDLFGNDGEAYIPMGTILPTEDRTLELSVSGGPAEIRELEVYELQSAWNGAK